MFVDHTLYHGRPATSISSVETAVYDALDALSISYTRAAHDPADSMELCLQVEEILGSKICKNLLLTNRQKTNCYLLMMPGDKPFKTKDLSHQLGTARLSFADAAVMEELLRTQPGSVSGLELIFDIHHRITLVIDKELLEQSTISGHPGKSTATVSMAVEDWMRYFASCGHVPSFVDLPRYE